jgi:hypothetical protein
MSKKIGITLMGFFMFLLFSGTAMSDENQGDERKGKFTYQKIYKACHEKA